MMETRRPGAEVMVSIEGCMKESAHAVFSLLRACFPSDREPGDVPQYAPEGRSMVWTADFDTSDGPRAPAEPLPLEGTVTVTLLGGCHAVDLVRDQLVTAFALREESSASGDQEKEVQLRLEDIRTAAHRAHAL
ncbi:hypothetical protein [Streptomyces sp. GC420]|uniref:hypothetical protein n=1 Tax=Streptomyces sp. GC420 TaxID=2697568 RepID=UPI001AA11DD3|nr:hypothetical protein [Streptomyces sp. GC420]